MLNKLLRSARVSTKETLRKFGQAAGLEIRLTGLNSRDDLRLSWFLEKRKIDVVIDVGANDGGFAKQLFSSGYGGKIISIEPIKKVHEKLCVQARDYRGRWIIGPPVALSDKNGTALFNITAVDTSSSLLKPKEDFGRETSNATVVQEVDVETVRLDTLVSEMDLDLKRTLLKLDVQGGEANVFSGAPKALQELDGVLTELSLSPLYEGQANFHEIDRLLADAGFELWDVWTGFRSPNNFRLLQIDGLYFKGSEQQSDEDTSKFDVSNE